MFTSAILFQLFAIGILATPQYQLPFNAQVPDVAFVNMTYSFTLSPSTFQSTAGPITYSLDAAPAWLQLNSDNMTMYGVPESSSVGSTVFSLVATDSTGSTAEDITLVVSSAPEVQLASSFAFPFQLPGKECGADCVLFPPNTPIEISFTANTFVTVQGQPLLYYATLSDHTPLPAWLSFNAENRTFTGTAPHINVLSTTLSLYLIGTNIAGFGVAKVAFTFIVSQHQFAFNNSNEKFGIPAGQPVNISDLIKTLTLDGSPVTSNELMNAKSNSPSWLSFDPKTLSLHGVPPNPYFMINVTIKAEDVYGDFAEMTLVINLGYAQLFTGHIGTLNATAGQTFYYKLDSSDLLESNLTILADLGAAQQWLFFNPSELTIEGATPNGIPPQLITANITFIVPNGTLWDAQEFYIQIQNGDGSDSRGGSSLSASKRAGIVAGAVIGGLFCIVSCLGICVICSRRRGSRKDDLEARRGTKSKRVISEPFPQRTADTQDSWAIGTYTDPEIGSNAPNDAMLEQVDDETGRRIMPPQVELNFKPTQGNQPSEAPALEHGSFMHRLISRHSLLASNRRSTLYGVDGVHPKEGQAALLRGQNNAKRARESSNIAFQEAETDFNDASSSIYSVEEARRVAFEAAASQPFDCHVSRPLPSLGHGQLPSNATWLRCSVLVPRSRPQSTGSVNGVLYKHADGIIYYSRPSMAGDMRPVSKVFDRGSALIRRRSSKKSNKSTIKSRPVSRRGPYPATFFGGGGSLQRKGSMASRRFADYGPGLTTISGSPILEANRELLFTMNSQGGAKEVFRDTEHIQPAQAQLPSLHHKRSQIDRTWSMCESDVGSTSWHTIGHGATSSFDENFDSAYSEVSSSARSARPSQTASTSNRPTIGQQSIGGLSIMERGRAAYRRHTSRERTPLQALGVNDKLGFGKVTKSKKGKEGLSGMGKLFVRGSREQRPTSVEKDVERYRSQRGETLDGAEAFL